MKMKHDANICNILICGFSPECGFESIHFAILQLLDNNKFKYFTINDVNIETSYNFFDVYTSLKYYDYIILCRRNILEMTDDKFLISKYLEQYNCWTLFASIIIGHEESIEVVYNKLFKLFNTPTIEHNNTIKTKNLLNFMISNSYL